MYSGSMASRTASFQTVGHSSPLTSGATFATVLVSHHGFPQHSTQKQMARLKGSMRLWRSTYEGMSTTFKTTGPNFSQLQSLLGTIKSQLLLEHPPSMLQQVRILEWTSNSTSGLITLRRHGVTPGLYIAQQG